MSTFQDRIFRAAKLDVTLYEEVEHDKGSMGQAIAVVVLSSLAAGIGIIGKGGLSGIVIGTAAALVSWYIWAWLAYFIGTRLLPEPQTRADLGEPIKLTGTIEPDHLPEPQTHADLGELLRTIGFSSAPGLIRIAGIIPNLGEVVFIVAAVWMLAAMVIAVRQALDYTSTLRAVGVCVIGWAIQIVIVGLLFALFGGTPQPA